MHQGGTRAPFPAPPPPPPPPSYEGSQVRTLCEARMRTQNVYKGYRKWSGATWHQRGPKMYQLVVVFVFKGTWPPVYSGRVPRYASVYVWCLERHPRTQTPFFGIVHCKHPHPRYPKTTLLACRVQRYRCLGRHPRTQTPFYGIVRERIAFGEHSPYAVGARHRLLRAS